MLLKSLLRSQRDLSCFLAKCILPTVYPARNSSWEEFARKEITKIFARRANIFSRE